MNYLDTIKKLLLGSGKALAPAERSLATEVEQQIPNAIRDVSPRAPKMLNEGLESIEAKAAKLAEDEALERANQNIANSLDQEVVNPLTNNQAKSFLSRFKKPLIGAGVVGAGIGANNLIDDLAAEPVEAPVRNPSEVKIAPQVTPPSGMAESLQKRSGDVFKASGIVPVNTEKQDKAALKQQPSTSTPITEENQTEQDNSIDFSGPTENTVAALKEVQNQQNLLSSLGSLSNYGDGLGAALIGQKTAGTGSGDVLIKKAKEVEDQYNARVAKEKEDASSSYSKGLQDMLLKRYGVSTNAPASAIEKTVLGKVAEQYENEQKAKLQKEMLDERLSARKEEAQQRSEDRKLQYAMLGDQKRQQKADRDTKEQNEFISKASDRIMKSKPFNFYQKNRNALEQIENAIQNPDSVQDVAALYSLVKGLDPDSAVREGEVALARNAQGIYENLKTEISRLGPNPRVVSTELLKKMKQYLKNNEYSVLKAYDQTRQSYYKQAKARGLSEDSFEQFDPLYDKKAVNPYVKMVTPEGQVLNIPTENKEKALTRGLKEIQ